MWRWCAGRVAGRGRIYPSGMIFFPFIYGLLGWAGLGGLYHVCEAGGASAVWCCEDFGKEDI